MRRTNGTPSEHGNYDTNILVKDLEYNEVSDNHSEFIHNRKKIRLQGDENGIAEKSDYYTATRRSIGHSTRNMF